MNVLLEWRKYEEQRREMFQVMEKDIVNINVQTLLEEVLDTNIS